MIVATTSVVSQLEELQLKSMFNVTLTVGQLQRREEVRTVLAELLNMSQHDVDDIAAAVGDKPISIKTLLMVVEMARQEGEIITPERFIACLSVLQG